VPAQTTRHALTPLVGVVVSLALVPVLWWVAFDAIPPLQAINAESSGNRFGPWVFTWALVWMATGVALFVAWLSYLSSKTLESPQ
jgi:cell division protein FtsX